jgi:uncharacterized protein with GYD domain
VEETKKAVESLGWKLQVYYFAFGNNDFYLIVDNPEKVNPIAGSLIARRKWCSKGQNHSPYYP